MSTNAKELGYAIGKLALEKKAQNILLLDLRGIADVFDFFLIISATSDRHLKVLSEFIHEEMKKAGTKGVIREGSAESGWVLLDYGDLIVHIFLQETRDFYQIERLFKDAKTTEIVE